jgi:uncharacterized protein (DUF58 family)
MTRELQPKLAVYLTIAAAGLLAGVAAGRPALAAIGATFAAFVLSGLLADRPPSLRSTVTAEPQRVLEGDTALIRIQLRSRRTIGDMRLSLATPAGIEPSRAPATRALPASAACTIDVPVRAARWGVFAFAAPVVTTRDAFGLVAYRHQLPAPPALRAYPRREALRRSVSPARTRARSGNRPSGARGDGLELAELREFRAGDRVRRIDWRASARRGTLLVSDRLLERNADVVLLLDTFSQVGDGRDGTLEAGVRAASALADSHLRTGDRVGVVGFGGTLQWLDAGSGARQRHAILAALLDSEVVFSYAWKDIRVLPRRVVAPGALVIAVTPLLDSRGVAALVDLRRRDFDVAALEVSPLPFVRAPRDQTDRIAHRLWHMRRDALRSRLRRSGLAVAEWTPPHGLDAAVEEVNRFRRFASRARVA